MFRAKGKPVVSVEVRLNGNTVKLNRDSFTVHDDDHLVIDIDTEIPIVQRPDTVAGVLVHRVVEVSEPVVEPE